MSRKMQWFQNARFGMFIHWGPYALQQNGEWSQNADNISTEDYERVADAFTAERFDADAWALSAKQAGMKYMVLTAKHHDGFCLWDTATTDWNAVKRGPRRDVVAEYVAACRRHGLGVGLYWSWVDWHQPDWAKQHVWTELDAWRKPLPDPAAQKRLIDFLHAQVRELMTRYGAIDMLWFDGVFLSAEEYRSREMVEMVRTLQPDILINDRSGLPGDFGNPEGIMPSDPQPRPWELCHCTHTSWGYQGEEPLLFNSPDELLSLLCDSSALGGNLLLNIGPRPDGAFAEANIEQLEVIGRWMALNGAAIYGTQRGVFSRQPWGVSTRKGNSVFLHIFRPQPFLDLHGLQTTPRSARLLADGTPVPFNWINGRFRLNLPRTEAPLPLVVAVEFETEPVVILPEEIRSLSDGSVLLTANDACLERVTGGAPILSLSPDALGGRLLNWRCREDRATWRFTVEEQDEFIVRFEYNAPDTINRYSRRCEFRLEDGQALRCAVPQSGGLHQWGVYTLAGRFRLYAGRHALSVQPYLVEPGILMNLRAVHLVPDGRDSVLNT